jgi:tRNA(Ile)-lysidine synthase TilS/MesJ
MTRAPAELRLVADLAAKALAAAGAPPPGDGVAVAVSGGADSLALLHALRALAGPRGWRLAVLTVDHGLRPGSAADAAFVADHAKALGLPARVLTLAPATWSPTAPPAPRRPPGRPGTGRCGRPPTSSAAPGWPPATPWTTRPRRCCSSSCGAPAPDGLAGMAVRTGRLLRPLLGTRRTETRAACAAMGLPWREDPTNADGHPAPQPGPDPTAPPP